MRGLFVTGTDTGAGKTVLAGAIAAGAAAAGLRVAACKPVLTGLDDPPGPDWPADDELLGRAAGRPAVVARRFGPPVSPHLAAELAGTRIELAELAGAVRAAAAGADTVVVEGVGGLLVPISREASVRDLAAELGLPLVVAARPGLGTISHSLLTLEAARAAGLTVLAVVMTPWPQEPSAMELSNRDTVSNLGGVPVLGLPALRDGSAAELRRGGAELAAQGLALA